MAFIYYIFLRIAEGEFLNNTSIMIFNALKIRPYLIMLIGFTASWELMIKKKRN